MALSWSPASEGRDLVACESYLADPARSAAQAIPAETDSARDARVTLPSRIRESLREQIVLSRAFRLNAIGAALNRALSPEPATRAALVRLAEAGLARDASQIESARDFARRAIHQDQTVFRRPYDGAAGYVPEADAEKALAALAAPWDRAATAQELVDLAIAQVLYDSRARFRLLTSQGFALRAALHAHERERGFAYLYRLVTDLENEAEASGLPRFLTRQAARVRLAYLEANALAENGARFPASSYEYFLAHLSEARLLAAGRVDVSLIRRIGQESAQLPFGPEQPTDGRYRPSQLPRHMRLLLDPQTATASLFAGPLSHEAFLIEAFSEAPEPRLDKPGSRSYQARALRLILELDARIARASAENARWRWDEIAAAGRLREQALGGPTVIAGPGPSYVPPVPREPATVIPLRAAD